jgi:TonB family protein
LIDEAVDCFSRPCRGLFSGAGSRRDVLRQLQAWWEVHGYYPRHASENDEGGTVTVHLMIWRDGNIAAATVVGSSGSPSFDSAATMAFRGGFVKPLPLVGNPHRRHAFVGFLLD